MDAALHKTDAIKSVIGIIMPIEQGSIFSQPDEDSAPWG